MKEKKTTVSSNDQLIKTPRASRLAGNTSQESINNLFDILNNLDAIIFVVDMQSYEILYANKNALNLLGNFTGKTCWQFLQGEVSGPCSFCSTKYLFNSDGTPHGSLSYDIQNTVTSGWYDVHERSVNLPDGRSVRIHLAIDITDKKKTIDKLKESEEKHRTVADYTYDWESWLNEKRNVEYISPSCQRITGHYREEFLSDPSLLKKIIHPEDRSKFIRHQGNPFQSPLSSHLEFRIISRDGTIKWISHYCQPVYGEDGSFRGRRSSNRDITERIKAEAKTKLNELRLSTLISLYEKKDLDTEEICDFVLESSLPMTSSSIGFLGFLNQNESVVTIHAWSKNVMRECAIHKKPIQFNVSKAGVWGEAVRQRQPFVINDFSLDSPLKKGIPEGHVDIDRFLAVPILSNNKVIAIVAVGNKEEPYTDDDADQLKLLLEGMWQIIQRKKVEKEVFQQSEKIRHFASVVAHDLKSPAISVYGLAKMLKEKYAQVLDERGLKYCEQIMKSSEQMSSLAEDINSYITTRDTPCDFEVLELMEIWNIVRGEFMLQLQDRNISWVEPNMEPVEIVGSRIGIQRIFRNLVENALKYGGDHLSEITMGYKTSEKYHILMVGNNGAGILEEDAKVIFQEFKRKPISPQVYGSGLGLAIVNEIAKKHKGRSWLENGSDVEPVFCVSIARDL